MRSTTWQVNAILASSLIFILALAFLLGGEACSAAALAGHIGVVAVHFAKRGNE